MTHKLKTGKNGLKCLFNHSRYRLILFVLSITACFFFSHPATAASPVDARYLINSGDTVKLRLTISAPSPQSLIIEQHLVPGTKVLSTSPRAKQANRKTGVVKWLLKGLSPGNIDITMRVSPSSASKNVQGIIRYRLPGHGTMTELIISK